MKLTGEKNICIRIFLLKKAKKSKKTVKVAVIDCGFDVHHAMFNGIKIRDAYDVSEDDTNVLNPTCSHGTYVAYYGLKKIGKYYYYFDSDGVMLSNSYQNIDIILMHLGDVNKQRLYLKPLFFL